MLKDDKVPSLRPPSEDRRRWVRFPIRLTTNCRIAESADESSWLAQIQNISHGGVKILCHHPVQRGTTILISPSDPRLLPQLARVVHVTSGSNGNWMMGCTFIRRLMDERELRAWLKSQNTKLPDLTAD